MYVDELFLTYFYMISVFCVLLLDVLQCIQNIDKLLNTAMNFRKSLRKNIHKKNKTE